MNLDWSKINRVVVFTGKDKNGNRYLAQFIKDYKSIFGHEAIEIGCKKCLNTMFDKYTKHMLQMKNSTDTPTKARLKMKYNGIQLKFGSNIFVTNKNITQELAMLLLNTHPHGEKLFDVLPEVEVVKDSDLTKKELNDKYPGLKKGTKKEMLAEIAAR